MEQINRDALFCDETEDYRCPSEADAGEVVTFYFRTEKNGADAVVLLEYDPETGALLQEWQMKRLSWECCAGSVGNGADTNRGIDGSGMADKSDSRFDYYSCALTLGTKIFSYVFQVTWGENVCLYDRIGLTEDAAAHPFRLIPGFHVPEWSKGALMYQIYVDRFCNGDPTNDTETNEYIYLKKPVTRVTDWKEPISTLDVGRFYGGDLQGVLDKLDYLKSLKIEAIYLNPVFVSPSNHKYDCQDYDHIDPHYGVILEDADGLVCPEDTDNDRAHKYMTRTADEQNLEASDAFFARLIEEAHKRGIRVLVDGVFNHTGREFFAFKDIQEKRWDSPYKDWYKGVNFDWQSPCGDSFGYEAWQGHFELPCLNLFNPDVRSYLFDVIRFWIDEFDIDGLRLDVAYCLDENFVRRLRSFCDSLKPDFFLVGEMLHGDYNRLMNDSMLHSATNYECYKGLYSSFNSMNMFEIVHSLLRQFGPDNWTLYKGKHLLSFVDNHDVTRVASILSNEAHLPLIYAMQFGMPGIPCVYYGSEWGAKARKEDGDPALRACFDAPEWTTLTDFISRLAAAKKSSEALNYGDFRSVLLTNKQSIFERKSANERVLVAINADSESFTAHFDAGCGTAVDLLTGETHDFGGGSTLPPYSAAFWKMEH